jgi:hypothetical protein
MNIVRKRLAAKLLESSATAIGKEIGVSSSFVCAVHSGRKRPGPKVLAFLGLEAFEGYRSIRVRRYRDFQ